jgi:hypothetical protein
LSGLSLVNGSIPDSLPRRHPIIRRTRIKKMLTEFLKKIMAQNTGTAHLTVAELCHV